MREQLRACNVQHVLIAYCVCVAGILERLKCEICRARKRKEEMRAIRPTVGNNASALRYYSALPRAYAVLPVGLKTGVSCNNARLQNTIGLYVTWLFTGLSRDYSRFLWLH